MVKNFFTFCIGGPQGSGIDTSARLFLQLVGNLGYWVYSFREYQSNIKGKHSYSIIVLEKERVNSLKYFVDFFVCYDEDSLATHLFFDDLNNNAVIVYNTDSLDFSIKNIRMMEDDLKRRILDKGFVKVSDILNKRASEKNLQQIKVDFNKIALEIADELKIPKGEALITYNTIALSISACYLGISFEKMVEILKNRFGTKGNVFNINYLAAKKSYEYFNKEYSNLERRFLLTDLTSYKKEKRILIDGNTAVALGKMIAGVSYQSYYPITPASDESVFIEANQYLDSLIKAEYFYELVKNGKVSKNIVVEEKNGFVRLKRGIVVHQAEDEISAIGSAIGAALTGARASTSTSSPGFSLMIEFLGWAGRNEVPVVITHYQRASPSTGLPTKSEQGDLLFSSFASHGTFPRLILASGDIEETFYDVPKVFNYAEKYQMPAIHLLDKVIANSTMVLPYFDLKKIKIERGKILTEKDLEKIQEYKRFLFTEDGISPRVFFGEKGGIHWLTGDESDEKGHITEDPETRSKIMHKRMKKLETAAKEISKEDKLKIYGNEKAKVAIISFGSTKGVILDSLKSLNKLDEVKFIQVRLLQPYPVKEIKEALENVELLIDVEMNINGQLDFLNRAFVGRGSDFRIYKITGRPIFLDELSFVLSKIFKGDLSEFRKDYFLDNYLFELKHGV